MTIERRDVTFNSGDSFVAGWFFLPEGGAPGARVPAVALAPGTGGVKELYHEPFARRFGEAGMAALLFAYRCFGTSGGGARPRGLPPRPIRGPEAPSRAVASPPGGHGAP